MVAVAAHGPVRRQTRQRLAGSSVPFSADVEEWLSICATVIRRGE
jgi:hypothetical protein